MRDLTVAYCLADKGRLEGPYLQGINIEYLGVPRLYDHKGAVSALLAGASLDRLRHSFPRILDAFPDLYQYTYDLQTQANGKPLPKLIFLYGPPGCGKSHKAREMRAALDTPSYWHNVSFARFFDGYKGEATLFIDGVEKHHHVNFEIDLMAYFLQLFERQPIRLPMRGGWSVPCDLSSVIITSYNPPWDRP